MESKMNAIKTFLGLLFVVCITMSVRAQVPDMPGEQGGFYGIITFEDCHCENPFDRVSIRPANGGDGYHYGARCNSLPPYGYTTLTSDHPYWDPGYYYISFVIREESDCDHTFVQYVYHGSEHQEVNLVVYGPSGGDPK